MNIYRKLLVGLAVGTTALISATAGANSVQPFPCTGDAYSVRGDPRQAQLFLIDQSVEPFVFTPIGSGAMGPFGAGGEDIPIQLNNLGYRVTDNLLYAVAMPERGNFNYGIVTIDSTGAVTPFLPATTAGWPADERLLAGDVSVDGNTMYINTYPTSVLYIVDLVNQVVTNKSITGTSQYVADWAVSPVDGNLYGGEAVEEAGIAEASVFQLTPGGVLKDLGQVAGLARQTGNGQYFGGSWFMANGILVLYRNSDFIYEIDLSTSPPTLITEFAGGGVNSQLNDAAACAATDIVKGQIAGPEEVGIYDVGPTGIMFEITYNGPATLIVDKVPAEFEVTACTPADLDSACVYYLDGNPQGPKAKRNSATIIEWSIPAPGTYTLEVAMETRVSSGNKKSVVYKPTSCGDMPINLGATAYEVDEYGEPVLDGDLNMIPLVTSNIPMVQAVAGTKPCAPQGVTVNVEEPDTLILDWYDNDEIVHHYNVYRGYSEDGPFEMMATPTVPGYMDIGLVPGTTYCYQVKAAFGPGDEAEGNESGAVCATVPVPVE